MTTHQERFYVAPNGIKIHYLEHGKSGANVLLIPGITTPAILWEFVAERLGDYARVFSIDNRGRGLSDQRPGLGYTLDDYAADAAGVIRELGLPPAVVLGHSMGARIGIRLAARYPDLVARLMLADPPVSGPGRRPYPIPLQQYLDNIDMASRGAPLPPSSIFTDKQLRLRSEWMATCSKEAVIATHRNFHEEDIFADLPRIRCPTLLLYAGQGGTVLDSDADELVAGIANAEKLKLEKVGHMMPWFDLELFLQSIKGFISEV
ncbi:MAG: alpha/beta hydrolase [Noviherbaspirillum sp.]|jgi:N-formylmaleamate deformylase|nr:alpha/beta hydrolase [Noviherbaspirillum sp.]MDB5793997.1 alpha/beta hydrolase [Noviherbaspirillum sp.]